MSAVRVRVTAEDIADGAKPGDPTDPNWHETHNRFWATPVEEAIARLTGENVDVDGGDGTGCIATIGQGAWTLVIDLPEEVNRFLDARWNGEGDGEPFVFALEVPEWVVALVARAASLEDQAAAVIATEPAVDIEALDYLSDDE